MSASHEPYEDPQESGSGTARSSESLEKALLDATVQGVKVIKGKGGPGSEEPESWREVGPIINRHLRKLAVGLTGLISDTVDATRSVLQGIKNFVRGTGELPGAAADRLRRTRAEVQADEDSKQAVLLDAAKRAAALPPGAAARALPPTRSAAEVLQDIAAKIEDLRIKGFDARLVPISPDEFAIVLVREGAGDAAVEFARYKLNEARTVPGSSPEQQSILVLQLPAVERAALEKLRIRHLGRLLQWTPFDLSTSLEADGMSHESAENLVATVRHRLQARGLDLPPDAP